MRLTNGDKWPRITASDLGVEAVVADEVTLWRNGRQMRQSQLPNGYLRVNVKAGGAQHTVLVHRAVAEQHVPNPGGLPCVNHLDGNKTNNRPSNLEWCTYASNTLHAYRTGLNRGYVRQPHHREALAVIARTYPRDAGGRCAPIENK